MSSVHPLILSLLAATLLNSGCNLPVPSGDPTTSIPPESGSPRLPHQVEVDPYQVAGLMAYAGPERVDLFWREPNHWHDQESWVFEVQFDPGDGQGFRRAHAGWIDVPAFSHFLAPGTTAHFRVRMLALDGNGAVTSTWPWSDLVSQSSLRMEDVDLVEDVQRASFRYFWNYRHPISGLPREGIGGWNRNMCSVAAGGMMFFNIATGIENGWITRSDGLQHLRKSLQFVLDKSERHHGVLPHWIHGATGKTIPFSEKDDGADLVETAFFISGALFIREYVKDDDSLDAATIRDLANRLWQEVEWTWFVKYRGDGRRPLVWHWSPRHHFSIDLEIVGFNESEIVYLLALASPTHPVSLDSYTNGWLNPGFGHKRMALDVPLSLGREHHGPPLFFAHYSYLGINPSALYFDNKSYYEHFQDFCRVQIRWALSQRREYSSGIWGLTAGMNPEGYGVQFPGHDNGTITPTAALASMPYAPDEVRRCIELLYRDHARSLWGPFGFRDGLNINKNWYSSHYIAIDVGPIAPMIQNHRTRLGWSTLMKAPEIQRALALLADAKR